MKKILFSLLSIFPLLATALQPDVTNKTLILSLAELAGNAYHDPQIRNTTAWRNSTDLFTYLYSYGWDVDGLRGHVFHHREENVVVISVKGTSLNSAKDKESANMICSCNCCYSNCTRECNRDRLQEGLPNMYLTLLLLAYAEVQDEFKEHDIWFTGHSMGAVIATLAGVKTCHPAIGFSAPGEQLFANRIGLQHSCPGHDTNKFPSIYHIGYYKDPIYSGTCGWLCWVAGYRMDSKCHHGYECVYKDSSEEEVAQWNKRRYLLHQREPLGSGMIYTHTINFLIDKVINSTEKVPICYPVKNCTEKCKDGDGDGDEDEEEDGGRFSLFS